MRHQQGHRRRHSSPPRAALGIKVLAEGIETLDEMMTLREMGISLFQGYLFAFPKVEQLPKVNWPMRRTTWCLFSPRSPQRSP
jgi:c-di-GMP-related signal transduction protein